MRILVVEDTVKMAALLKRGLEESGHVVDVASNGEDAVWMGLERPYDAVVLDVGLGDVDGFEVCRRLRSGGLWAPVLMLTARDGVPDRVRGLDSGADDYLTKPFAMAELAARVRALVRRVSHPRPAVLEVGNLTLDPATRVVRRGEQPILLTPKEFSLLECLMHHAGEVMSRTQLVDHVWDFAFDGDPHVVAVYVGYVRDKIDRPFGRASLVTVRGMGYKLHNDGPAPASD